MRRLDELSDDELLEVYRIADRTTPHLRANFVSSLDGAVEIDGQSKALSSESDSRVFSMIRRLADVVLVGAGTIRDEGYTPLKLSAAGRSWRSAAGLPENPTLAVVSARLDLSPVNPIFRSAVRPLVITHEASPPDRREALGEVADVLVLGAAEVDLPAVVIALADRGLPQILCEGGPHLLGAMTTADLVDELDLALAPLLAGPGSGRITAGPPTPLTRQLRLATALVAPDDYLFFRYVRES
ncbi:pyrimidine reductase family protein [Kribbella sandramycini]|uniref:Pyrimidine reductase family protein n=1 Tax=Kribbella sandramycini TaxID=60450 RepID=A0A7Y4P1C7_9ACTN|nr:pyrimidine reductase family protein [Kribbella sandramycini]MBB6571055.1 riboflavin biosynthesis pyrimidine reductase [Kribbella sandramycini]NOL43536.1 pyrimidine reductase family protein [Kribbella sandramycini]